MILPKFSIITGIDCCGKGTIFDEIVSILEEKKIAYLDLREQSLGDRKLSDYEAILTCEPTKSSRLRTEMFHNSREYSTREFAEEFSSDREKQYREIIIPAHESGIVVLQDRGFTDSLVYQPIQAVIRDEDLTLEEVMKLKGNVTALENLPGAIFITHVSAGTAEQRRKNRTEKIDTVEFESGEYPQMLEEGYRGGFVKKIGRLNWRRPIEGQIKDIECEEVRFDIEATKQLVIENIKRYYEQIGCNLFI